MDYIFLLSVLSSYKIANIRVVEVMLPDESVDFEYAATFVMTAHLTLLMLFNEK